MLADTSQKPNYFFVFGHKKTAVNCPVYNSLGLCLFRCFWIELSMYYCSKFADRGQGFAEKNEKKTKEDKLTFQVGLDTFPMEISSYKR